MKISTIAKTSGALWAISFFLSLGTIPPLEIERLESVLFSLIALVPLLICGTPLARKSIAAPSIAMMVLALWLLATLSCAWSVAPPVSLTYLGVFCVMPATILALLLADPDMRQSFFQSAAYGTGIIVVGLAAWALIQIFFLPHHLVFGQVRDPFANPNIFAALLSLSFFTGFALWLRHDHKKIAVLIVAGLLIILCALIGMAGKTASLGLLVGISILLVFAGRGFIISRRKSIFALFTGAALVELAINLLPGRSSLIDQIGKTVNGDTVSFQSRLDIWKAAWTLIEQHPFIGSGYRTFALMYPSVRLPSEIYSGGFMAHNDALQLWSEIGVLGPILFYGIAIASLLRFFKYWRPQPDHTQKIATLSVFLGCAIFFAHSHVDFPFYAMPAMMVFALAFSTFLENTGPDRVTTPISFMQDWPRGLAAFALIAPVGALVLLFAPIMLGEYKIALAQRYLAAKDVKAFYTAIGDARTIGLNMNDRVDVLISAIPMGQLQMKPPLEQQRKLFRQTDRLLNRSLQKNSRLSGAWQQRGMMILLLDPRVLPAGYPTAEDCFQKALSLNPLYLPARMALADQYMKRGDKQGTLDILVAGVVWPYATLATDPFYERAEKLARNLRRNDLLPAIALARTRQKGRIITGTE